MLNFFLFLTYKGTVFLQIKYYFCVYVFIDYSDYSFLKMDTEAVKLFDNNLELYSSILKDIQTAKESVFLEFFRFNTDAMGENFRNALALAASRGVEVKVLVDSWGTENNSHFFGPISQAGGTVRFYKKIRWFNASFFAKNHCRNHRKLVIIDRKISYLGSSNISAYSLSWRELNLRLVDEELGLLFTKAFFDSYNTYKIYELHKNGFKRDMHYKDMIIMQEVPAIHRQRLKQKYELLIHIAKKSVVIETPYFLPGYRLRKTMVNAVKRGVKVLVIIPRHSDVLAVDIIRRHYLGVLAEKGVDIQLYELGNLHAKGLLIDDEIFSIGSANFDYRSFRYQYEISLIGKDDAILPLLQDHLRQSMRYCRPFDYMKWKKRSTIDKIIENLLLPFRYLM